MVRIGICIAFGVATVASLGGVLYGIMIGVGKMGPALDESNRVISISALGFTLSALGAIVFFLLSLMKKQ